MNITADELIRFLGPFHPLLTHLPIGFLFLLGAIEALAIIPRLRPATAASRTIIVLSVPATILAAVCGWFLAERGGYDSSLLAWHRWFGVGVAVAVFVLLLLHIRDRTVLYRLGLLTTLALIVYTGHLGGTITHGRGFLTRNAPEALRPWLLLPPATAEPAPASTTATALSADSPVYVAAIQPILDEYCIACHGPEKSKGDLRLDSIEAVLKGGENGPAIVAGKSSESAMIKLLRLPADHDDHMPPTGKPQPSQDAIAILAWWIDAGADATRSARALGAPPAVIDRLGAKAASTPPPPPSVPPPSPSDAASPQPSPAPETPVTPTESALPEETKPPETPVPATSEAEEAPQQEAPASDEGTPKPPSE